MEICRKKIEYEKVDRNLEDVVKTEEIKEISTKDNQGYLNPKNIEVLEESITFTLGKNRFVVQKNNIEEIVIE